MTTFGRLPVNSIKKTLKLTKKYERARAACNPDDYMQDYTEEKAKKLKTLPKEMLKFKPSENYAVPLFPKKEHDRIMAETIDEYD